MKKILVLCVLSIFLLSSCGGLSEDIGLSAFDLEDSKSDSGKGIELTLKKDSSISYGNGNKLTFEFVNYYPRDKFPEGITIEYCIGGVHNLIEGDNCGTQTITRFKREGEESIKGEFSTKEMTINENIREGDYTLKFEYCHNSMSYAAVGICSKSEGCSDEVYDIFGDFSYEYHFKENEYGYMNTEFYLNLKTDVSKLRNICNLKSGEEIEDTKIEPTFKITANEIDCDLKEGYYETLTEENQRIEYKCSDDFESPLFCSISAC